MNESVRLITDTFVPRINNDAAWKRAHRYLDDRVIAHPTLSDIDASHESLWATALPRTHGRYLHGFLFLADWHKTILSDPGTRDGAYRKALALFLSWFVHNSEQPGSAEMSFHDETTAQRSLQMARILDEYPGQHSPETRELLRGLVVEHLRLLSSESFYAGNNNHGMFQDIALLRLVASRTGVAVTDSSRRTQLMELATRRLEGYFTSCFSSDGVHVENSPGYHLMVSRYLRDLIPVVDILNPSASKQLRGIYAGAERYSTHVIMPDGFLPPLGDTKYERVRDISHRTTFGSDEYLFSVYQGQRGTSPSKYTAVFPEAGYAIYHSSWESQDQDWVLFKSGYRSNYHHHADDLSLIVHSHGRLLLAEAGPYGYDYADPLTKYAFSQFAHNVVTVDHASQPRVDPVPGGVYFEDLAADSSGEFDVQGINCRSAHSRHCRRVTITRSEGTGSRSSLIRVNDNVTTDDGRDHEFVLRWHLGAETRPVLRGNSLELFLGPTKVLELTWSGSQPLTTRIRRAGDDNSVQAHQFPRFGVAEPAAVLEIRGLGESFNVSTSIRTGEFVLREWGMGEPGSLWGSYQADMPVNYLLEPREGASKLVVVFSAMAPVGSFTYNYRQAVADLNAHTLFVMDDFGDQGAYFYANHRDLGIYRSVLAAVTAVKNQLGVDWSDVAFVGSSKGGTAALIFGGSVPVGRIVVGAPQTRVGTFLKVPHPNILEYMTGGTGDTDTEWADRIVANHVRRMDPRTSVDLIIGTRDHHYRDHLPLLKDELSRIDHSDFHVREVPNLTHAEIGKPFRAFIQEQLGHWSGLQDSVRSTSTTSDSPSLHANVSGSQIAVEVTGVADSVSAAYYLYEGKKAVRKTTYVRNGFITEFEDLPPGVYRVRCFLRSASSNIPTTVSSQAIRVT